MIENIILVGGPLDGQKRPIAGGNEFMMKPAQCAQSIVYRRAHADSKFFRFSETQG